jgi:hypothetical protein
MVYFGPQISVGAVIFLGVGGFPIFCAIIGGDKVVDGFRVEDLVVDNDICYSVTGQRG